MQSKVGRAAHFSRWVSTSRSRAFPTKAAVFALAEHGGIQFQRASFMARAATAAPRPTSCSATRSASALTRGTHCAERRIERRDVWDINAHDHVAPVVSRAIPDARRVHALSPSAMASIRDGRARRWKLLSRRSNVAAMTFRYCWVAFHSRSKLTLSAF